MVTGPEFFQNNRKAFAEKLPDNTAAFLFSGEEKKMCADTEYRFLPDRNYFYLTGLEKPDLMLIIRKQDGIVTIDTGAGELSIAADKISKINLAVVF